ncbi:hypothetical protein [Phytohabitans kaempferiae]|uniref:Helix-turn-helix domain-containing protein n=1 Tax=Phytohabitans kaempferiae TaxID=1620943 RepID=A0ABV6MBJ8_9ACTN
MSRFVITIAPDNTAAGDADNAFTTVRVDTSTGQARITELTVRAAAGGGLTATDLPPIDMNLLIRALTVAAQPQALPSVTPASTPAPAADRVDEPERAVAAPVSAEPSAAAPRRRARKGAAGTGSARKTAAGKSGARRATAKKATAAKKTAKATARGGSAPDSTATAPRPYRRMPEPEQVMDVYRLTGSIAAVADHFGVPRHTVAGWARRLRGQGHSIGRQ